MVKAPKEQRVKAMPAFGPIDAAALPAASRLMMIGAAANAEKVLKRLSFCSPQTSALEPFGLGDCSHAQALPSRGLWGRGLAENDPIFLPFSISDWQTRS